MGEGGAMAGISIRIAARSKQGPRWNEDDELLVTPEPPKE